MAKHKKKKKHRKIRPRAIEVEIMILHCKPGAHLDLKKERSKRACRNFKTCPTTASYWND